MENNKFEEVKDRTNEYILQEYKSYFDGMGDFSELMKTIGLAYAWGIYDDDEYFHQVYDLFLRNKEEIEYEDYLTYLQAQNRMIRFNPELSEEEKEAECKIYEKRMKTLNEMDFDEVHTILEWDSKLNNFN